MTIQPRDVLSVFKPKLVPKLPTVEDRRWAAAVATMREAISDCQNLAMETSYRHPERFDEVSNIAAAVSVETQNMKTATLGASGSAMLDEMHKGDPNYTPGRLPPDCEFAAITE